MGRPFDLGFLGGGQLARMSILAARWMGLRCLSLDPGGDTPASQVAPALRGDLADPRALAAVLAQCERVTLENEFVLGPNLEEALGIAGRPVEAVVPAPDTLAAINDKLRQRQALAAHGVPSPPAVALEPETDPPWGFPTVIKARHGGYDGKGTRTVRSPAELEALAPLWEGGGWLAEAFVPFRRELAVMVCRSPRETLSFPTVVTEQVDHVCDLVWRADVDGSEVAIAAVEAVGGHGLFGVELFELEDGMLMVNEIAPRPHNAGHLTLDWGGVSQFEQHVRLAMGFPCVPPEGAHAAMANLLGRPETAARPPDAWLAGLRAALEAVPAARVHWYGKVEARPGRKMGHLNAIGNNARDLVQRARSAFYGAWVGDSTPRTSSEASSKVDESSHSNRT